MSKIQPTLWPPFRRSGTTVTQRTAGDKLVLSGTGEMQEIGSSTLYGGGEKTKLAAIQTTDAAVKVLTSIPVAAGEVYSVEIDILGRKSDGSDRANYKLTGLFYRNTGGDVTLEGLVTSICTTESDATWDCNLAANTGTQAIDVQVVGAAGATINWNGVIKYHKVT